MLIEKVLKKHDFVPIKEKYIMEKTTKMILLDYFEVPKFLQVLLEKPLQFQTLRLQKHREDQEGSL